MVNPEDWEKDFQQIVGSLNGEAEVPDEIFALIDASNRLSLKKDEAQIDYLKVLTSVNAALVFAILSGTILGIAWSFYAWFK